MGELLPLYPVIKLRAGKDEVVRRFHPWIFSGAIGKVSQRLQAGDIVTVTDYKDEILGTGFCETGSIAVKLLSFENTLIDSSFWKTRLEKCLTMRESLGLLNNKHTKTMEQLLKKNPRIEVVDALRGFAVMAIILVHNLEHFIFPVYPTDSPTWLNVLDQGVFNAVFSLFAGKAYAIFALLFGFTFYIQSNNQKRQGKDFGYRFLWRLVLLAGFATLNAAFFPAGDVLLLFVVVGLVLFLTRNWSDKAILVTSIIFLLQPVEWYHYVAN